MIWVKQSTARTVPLGPFVDATDAVTAETGLTIAQADIRLSKNGGAFAQTNNSAGATHMENGYYGVPLDTTDTGTLGHLRVAVNESGALPVWLDCMVLPANVWDSFFGADKLEVDATQIAGAAVSTTTAQIGVNVVQVSGDATAADNLEAAADGTGYNLGGGSIVAASVTGNVGGNVTGSIGSLGTQAKADVNAEADTALADYDPPTHAELVSEINAVQTDIANLNDPTAATIADAVWDEAQADHETAGSFGEVATEVAAILVDTGTTLDGKLDTIDANVDSILADTGTDGVKIATGAITASQFGAGAVDAAALATDAVNEIRNAITGGAYALATEADGMVQANVKELNGTTLTGTGASGSEWGPA